MKNAFFILIFCILFIFVSCDRLKEQTPEPPSASFETVVEADPDYKWDVEIDAAATQHITDGVTAEYYLQLSLYKKDGVYSSGAYSGSYQISCSIDAGSYKPMLKLIGLNENDLAGTASNRNVSFTLEPFNSDSLNTFAQNHHLDSAYDIFDTTHMSMLYGNELTFEESDLGLLDDEAALNQLRASGFLHDSFDDLLSLFQEDRMSVPFLLTLHSDGKAKMTFFINLEPIVFEGSVRKSAAKQEE